MRATGVTLTEDFFDAADEWRGLMTDRDSSDVQALLDTTEGYIDWVQAQTGQPEQPKQEKQRGWVEVQDDDIPF